MKPKRILHLLVTITVVALFALFTLGYWVAFAVEGGVSLS